MLDWLAVGNGWRNLYLLSVALQAAALGVLLLKRRAWLGCGRLSAFLWGVAATPFVQYLWTLLLALVWPHAPKAVYIGVLPAAAGAYLLVTLLRNLRGLGGRLRAAWDWLTRLCRLDRPALVSLCFALAMALLLAPICVRLTTSTYPAQADAGEYMALGQRFCEDRSLPELLDKDDATGHFRGNSHFPSLELYMAYGLFHTGETIGYPYDKPMFTGLGLLTLYLLAAYAALLIRLTRGNRRWILLGLLLFNLVPNYVYSLSGASRDAWRCLALMLGAVALLGLTPGGGLRRYLGKLLWMGLLGFAVMSAHVVCFVVWPFMVLAWALAQWLWTLRRGAGGGGRALLRAAGLSLGAAAGTLTAYAGNLWCYFKWGEMSPWRLMTTYTDAPWYALYLQGEYKLEETTTHLNFWQARYDIVMAYATPLGLWGLRLALAGLLGALAALVVRRVRVSGEQRRLEAAASHADGPVRVYVTEGPQGAERTARFRMVVSAALLTLLTLAPMSGLLDTPMYSFSGSFLTMQRYTLQWYLFAGGALAAVLAALEAEWPALLAWAGDRLHRFRAALQKRWQGAGLWARRIPALLGALLCVLAFAQGTQESGYANSFYRYGRPFLTDPATALDQSFQERYELLMKLDALVTDGRKILVTRPGYQYALHARGYILTSNPIVPLMNLPLAEVGPALAADNVVALCTEPDFWDERYYALSTLSEYLNSLPPEQILSDGHMRVYLLDASLAAALRQSMPKAETGT